MQLSILMYDLFMKTFLLIIFSSLNLIHAKITPPNYDFTLQTVESFFPSKSVEDIKKNFPKFQTMEDNGDSKILKIKVVKKEYSFEVYIQSKKDVVTDAYFKMPQYFNHDQLLKMLQDKWKKQDKFKNKDRSSLYVWFNRDQQNILYHGSCSITCFPVFFEVVSSDPSVTPLYKKFNEALPTW